MATPNQPPYIEAWVAACKDQPADLLIGEFNVSKRGRISEIVRGRQLSEAKNDGDNNTLAVTTQSSLIATSSRWTQGRTQPIISIEYDVRDLWHLYYVASMSTTFDRPEQDRLVTQILFARELGALQRLGENGDVVEEAMTGDGKIFLDLPYLVEDMTRYWVEHHSKMEAHERQNFSAFLAKLCSVGVLSDRLSGIALILFRGALEIPNVEEGHLGAGDLLRSIDMWLYYAGDKIIDLCEKEVNTFSQAIGSLGEVARNVPGNGGFSIQRYIFWIKRFQELEAETKEKDSGLSEKFERSKNGMKTMASRIDTLLWRELKRQGLSEYRVYDASELKEGKTWI